jgi:hypothetical protein
MASIINLPSRGQPIDLSYIAQLAKAINEISAEIGTSSNNKYVTIKKGSATSKKISETKIFAGYVDIYSGVDVKAGDEKSVEYSFDINFSSPPIVTATINNGTENAGAIEGGNAIVTVKNISTSTVTINVKYNSPGKVTTRVNVIAIGD